MLAPPVQSEGTVEERMLALQAKKAALVRGIHDSAERRASGFALGADEIAALLAPIDDAPEVADAPAQGVADAPELAAARTGRVARSATRSAGRSRARLRVVPRPSP